MAKLTLMVMGKTNGVVEIKEASIPSLKHRLK
jgi:hypothetical protein